MHEYSLSGIRKKERKILFLNYLDSELRGHIKSVFSSSDITSSGHVSHTQAVIESNGVESNVNIVVVEDIIDGISCIRYEGDDSSAELLIKESIVAASQKAIDQHEEEYYFCFHYCYVGEQLDGEYWFNGVRLAPFNYIEENKIVYNMERYVTLEINSTGLDEEQAKIVAVEKADRLIAIVSFLLDIGFYQPKNTHVWVLSEPHYTKSVLAQRGFISQDQPRNKMPAKKKLCKSGGCDDVIVTMSRMNDTIKLPKGYRDVFRLLDELSEDEKEIFCRAALMYQMSLNFGEEHPTVQISYMVSAIDTLSKVEKNTKDKNFGAFIRKYTKEYEEREDVIDFMHGKVRSGHFHSGEFQAGEYTASRNNLITFKGYHARQLELNIRNSKILLRRCFINWINSCPVKA